MESLLFDVRLALRSLFRQRTFLAVSALTFALAVGANTTIFNVLYGVVLAPLGYPDEDRLYAIHSTNPTESLESRGNYLPDFWFWRENTRVFDEMAFHGFRSLTLQEPGRVERIESVAVSANLFPMLGLRPLRGRLFEPEDERAGVGDVALVSARMWERVWGRDPGVVGRAVRLSGRPVTIVGVMPPETDVPSVQADLWFPVGFFESYASSPYGREERDFQVIGRLAEGVAAEAARAELERFSTELAELFPSTNAGWSSNVKPLKELLVGDAELPLVLSFAAVALVLLIACANVANLVLVRALGRSRELAVRTALGAGRARIARQQIVEGLLLTFLGGGLGVLLALALTHVLLVLEPGVLPRRQAIGFGAPALVFAALASLVTGVGFGATAALYRSRSLAAALRVGLGQLSGTGRQGKLRMFLAGSQLALALALLAGAGSLSRSLLELSRVDPGFRPEGAYASHVLLGQASYSEPADRVLYFRRLVESVRATPGIDSAAVTTTPPVAGMGIQIDAPYRGLEGPLPSEPDAPRAAFRVVGPGYFETIGIPRKAGRDFTRRDDFDTPPVVVVNEALARRAFGEEDALGLRLRIFVFDREHDLEIVGVVGDTRFDGPHRPSRPAFFLPHAQMPFFGMAVVARTRLGPASYAETIRRAALAQDPSQPILWVQSLEEALAGSLDVERFYSLLLAVFAFVAVSIAASGVYGVFAYWVEQNHREVGLRLAVGGSPREIVAWILKRGAAVAAPSLLVGLGAAAVVSRALSATFSAAAAVDPVALAAAFGVLATVAACACYFPARRASRISPSHALRAE